MDDMESGTVLILVACASYSYGSILGKIGVSRYRSSNNGIEWSAPEDITNSIYGLNSSWSSLFFASGRIC